MDTTPPRLLARLKAILSTRHHPKTICPSEVPRSFTAAEINEMGVSGWRELMTEVRSMVSVLRDEGTVEVLQHGEVVDQDIRVEDITGPIRVRNIKE